MSSYIYKGEPESRVFGAIPAGDYNFIVASASEPYTSKSGNLVLPLRLTILPQDIPVFANPWCGQDSSGNERDGIAEFLLSVARAPKVGEEPDWDKLVGARGKCRIKVEIAQAGTLAGKEVNKVAFFHRPKQVGPVAEQKYSEEEFARARKEAAVKAGGGTQLEPDDIPF